SCVVDRGSAEHDGDRIEHGESSLVVRQRDGLLLPHGRSARHGGLMLARPFFVANWKMNMLTREAGQYVTEFRRLYKVSESGLDDTVLAPPYTLLPLVRVELGGLPGVLLASQNVHWEDFGSHTGEVSAPMLRELGVSFAIVGHSERRA